MTKENTRKILSKKFIKIICIYILIGVVLTTSTLYYLNNFLLSDQNILVKKPDTKNTKIKESFNPVSVSNSAKHISLTYDRNYVTYIDSGKLYIKNTRNNEIFKIIQEETPVVYAFSLSDRNIIVYFTYEQKQITAPVAKKSDRTSDVRTDIYNKPKSKSHEISAVQADIYNKPKSQPENTGQLKIKTYNIDKNEKTDHKNFTVKDFYGIKDVKYSSLTNLIYINIETNENKTIKNRIYRIDIMKNASVYTSNKTICHIELLNHDDTLIYEDTENNIYINKKLFKYQNNKKFKLLGIDDNDYIYLLSIDQPGNLFTLKNNTVKEKRLIENLNNVGIFSKDNKILLIYKDYALDLIKNEKVEIPPDAAIIDLGENYIYYKNINNEIIASKKVSLE
jgi:hypothetical protein